MADYEGTGSQIRKRFRDIDPLSSDEPNKAFAEYLSLAPATPLGHVKVSVGTTAVGLPSLPSNCRRVYLTPLGQPIEFRDDGVTPDGSNGYPIPANTHFNYDTEPSANFLMVRSSTATADADVRIAYYG